MPVASAVRRRYDWRGTAAVVCRGVKMKELRILRIQGKVQGVGFRFYATRVARKLGLTGWIQNLRDGSVECQVEGEPEKIDELVDELREGPRFAEVSSIEQERKDFTGKLRDFDVRF